MQIEPRKIEQWLAIQRRKGGPALAILENWKKESAPKQLTYSSIWEENEKAKQYLLDRMRALGRKHRFYISDPLPLALQGIPPKTPPLHGKGQAAAYFNQHPKGPRK